MSASAVANKRLRKEFAALQVDPPPGVIAEPDEANILVWHYVLQGPTGTPYEGGEYVGKLKFPPSYPMSPPSVMMCTPSGRFRLNTRLCLSMSDFHPESWNPMWSVSTLLQGVVSFMNSEEVTTGGLQASEADRKKLAALSKAYNQKHFAHLFDGDMAAAFARAEQAWKQAEAKRAADAAKAEAAAAKKQSKVTQPAAVESSSQPEKQQESSVELTEEQKEKRRLKNSKKRAKQKAKRANAANAASVVEDTEQAVGEGK